MVRDGSVESYSYSGHLLFNRIHKIPQSINKEVIEEALPTTQSYRPEGDHFEPIIESIFRQAETELWDINERWVSDVLAYKYVFQELVEQDALVDGELKTVHLPTEESADLFISPMNYLFVRGNEQASKKAGDAFLELFRKNHSDDKTNMVEFNSEFLLWLFYRQWVNNPIDHGISIVNLTDAKVVGQNNTQGEINRVSGSTSIVRSVPILDGLLRGKELTKLGGHFFVQDYGSVGVDIQSNKVHIRIRDSDLQSYNDASRMIMSILFLERLCEVYDHWRGLAPSEKYPGEDFFEGVYSELQEEGFELDYTMESVMDEYQAKRSKGDNGE